MYNLYVHISHTSVICRWGKPLCGFKPQSFKSGRFNHPDVKIFVATTVGAKFDYHSTIHAIMVALENDGFAVNRLTDTRASAKRKAKSVGKEQLRLF